MIFLAEGKKSFFYCWESWERLLLLLSSSYRSRLPSSSRMRLYNICSLFVARIFITDNFYYREELAGNIAASSSYVSRAIFVIYVVLGDADICLSLGLSPFSKSFESHLLRDQYFSQCDPYCEINFVFFTPIS